MPEAARIPVTPNLPNVPWLGGMKGVTVLRTPAASLSGPDNVSVYTQIDGEVAGHLPAQVRIVPDALTLLIPPEYSKRVP